MAASASAWLPPIYPILDLEIARRRGFDLPSLAAGMVALGLPIVQLRAKRVSASEFLSEARAIRTAMSAHSPVARLIVNDRADVALLAGADGVHLGQDDLSANEARSLFGRDAIVGFSTHNADQLAAAAKLPIDYVALGPIFATQTKADAEPVVGVEALGRLRPLVPVPLVAIGGITLENCAAVWRAGADSIALISGWMEAPDPLERARAFLLAFQAR
jgi:thiamine-phosphate pyrophosphorylase